MKNNPAKAKLRLIALVEEYKYHEVALGEIMCAIEDLVEASYEMGVEAAYKVNPVTREDNTGDYVVGDTLELMENP